MRESRESNAIIAVVDDDPSAREGLSSLIRSAGLQVETFASAQEFLARPGVEAPSCLVLDLQLPGLSGLDLQKRMAEVGMEIPIVFLTGHGNIPASVQAMNRFFVKLRGAVAQYSATHDHTVLGKVAGELRSKYLERVDEQGDTLAALATSE